MANLDITNGANYLASLNLDGGQVTRLRSAARAMGMSEQEAARTIERARRKIERRGTSNSPIDKIVDAFINRGGAVNEMNQEMPADIDDNRTVPNSVLEYGEFGNQDELQNFGGRDKQGRVKNAEAAAKEIEKARGKRDPNVVSRAFFEKGKEGLQREEVYVPDGMPVPERFVEAAKDRDFGIYGDGAMAPAAQVQRIERDALQQGVDQYGADAFPGAVDVIGRIEDDIQGNREGERALVRDMVRQERDGLASDEIRRRADRQLQQEFAGNDTPGSPVRAMPVDAYRVREAEILADLGRIRQNAEAVEANNWRAQAAANIIGQDFQVGGRGARADQAIENIRNISILGPAKNGDTPESLRFRYDTGPTGTGIPDTLPLDLPDQYNAPVSDNRFAGPLQRQEQWLYDQVKAAPDPYSPGAYAPVAINEQMGLARQAIENAKIKGVSVDLGDAPIRNIAELQAAADQVLSLGQQQGVGFFNNVDGKNVYNPNPGIGEVLERGGMNARAIGDVVRANQQVANAVRGEAVKLDRPVAYGGDHPALGGGAAKVAMIGREKIEGREVKAQLQRLDGRRGNPGEPLDAQELAQARMPFQGGVAGEGVKRARFVRGADRGLSEDAIYEKYGPVNGQIANAVIQRAEQAQGSNSDGFGMRVERQRNMDPGTTFDIGPDPWSQPVGTGNGITQERVRREGAKPQAALPYGIQTSGQYQGPNRPLTTELKNELAALSSGFAEQGPRPAFNYTDPGIKPDGPTFREPNPKQVRAFADYRKMRRYGRNAAIAGGAGLGIAGLDGLINGERNKREEEQYQ